MDIYETSSIEPNPSNPAETVIEKKVWNSPRLIVPAITTTAKIPSTRDFMTAFSQFGPS